MKEIRNIFLTLLLFFTSSVLFSQELDQQKILAEYENLGLPGSEHAMLAKLEGTWKQTYKNYMVPNAEPIIETGEGKMEMILEGRFLKWTSKGEIMGRTIKGMTILGYDNRLKIYTAYGFDTMGTYAVTAEGKMNETSGSIEYKGKNYEPAISDYSDFRFVFKPGEKEFVFEVFIKMPGKKEIKILETTGMKFD